MVGKHRHAIKKFKNEEDQGNNGGSWGFSMECEIYIFDGSILQFTGKSHVKKIHGFGYWDILSKFAFYIYLIYVFFLCTIIFTLMNTIHEFFCE